MDFQVDIVKAICVIGFFLVWLARLEFLTIQNKKDIEVLWTKHDAVSSEFRSALSKVSESLARIEGFLSKDK